jgi:hypothetical protein
MSTEIFQNSCGDKYTIENGVKVWLDDDLRPVYPCTEKEKEIIRQLKIKEQAGEPRPSKNLPP